MKLRSSMAGLALVAGLGVAVAGCGQVNQVRAQKAFKDANKLYAASDWRAAAAKYEEAIQLNPENAYSYFFLANSLDNLYRPTRVGEPENDALLTRAIDNYKLAAQNIQDPLWKRRSFEFLVAAYGPDKLNDPTMAEPIVKQMIELDPTDPANYFQLASIYENSGEYELAEQTFMKAKEAKPNDPNVYMQLAGYYNRQGDFPKTIEALGQRVALEPNNPEAHYTVSTYYWDKAYRDFRLKDAEKLEMVIEGHRVGRQGHRHQGRLHGGDRLQEPAAPAPGQPDQGSGPPAGADPRGRPAPRPRRADAQGEDTTSS